jgi:hypothetical protein
MKDLKIQFGKLHNAFGKTAEFGHVSFVPAEIDLNGNGFSKDYELSESASAHPPAVLLDALEHGYDAAWVRARLPNVFGFIPSLSEVEKSLLDVGFVAVINGEEFGYPFICSDYYGRTRLMFSPEGPDRNKQSIIAKAFWSLLLDDPDTISDFKERVYHPGASIWMLFGCTDGVLSYSEEE